MDVASVIQWRWLASFDLTDHFHYLKLPRLQMLLKGSRLLHSPVDVGFRGQC